MLGDIYRVSFIGHHEVEHFREVEEQLERIVVELIRTKEHVEFYVGRNGEFDIMVASVIKRTQRDYGYANSSLILVIPYPIANLEDMEKYYDEVLYPVELYRVNYKVAITKMNVWMVQHSDLLIAYVTRKSGGAYNCLRFAREEKIKVINICK